MRLNREFLKKFFRGSAADWVDWFLDLPTRAWIIFGLTIINIGSATPFGISDTTTTDLTDFEWVASVVFALVAIGFILSARRPRALSWMAFISGCVWFGTCFGGFVSNYETLDWRTNTAISMLAFGISMCSFGLWRLVEHTSPGLPNKKNIGNI